MALFRIHGTLACLLGAVLLSAIVNMAHGAVAPMPEARSALAPYAMWVGRLPPSEAATWSERKTLAFYRGRLGAWLEAELQVKAARSLPVRHAELCVQLARAARFNEDWERVDTWFLATGEALKRVPEGERTVELSGDYYAEAVALREVTDVRAAYGAMAHFLTDNLSHGEGFDLLRRLVDLAVVAGDEDSYTKLATSLLSTARAWNNESPAADGLSDADLAVGAFAESLISRGYAGTAAQLIEAGIADKSLRETLARAGDIASAAREDEAAIARFLANQSTPEERATALFGPDESHAGILVWLARLNRPDMLYQLLASERDRPFSTAEGDDRARHEQAWSHGVRRVAAEFFHARRVQDAIRFADLYSDARATSWRQPSDDAGGLKDQDAGSPIDLTESLVGFATFLAEHGRAEEAQRLLEDLPSDYPRAAEMENVPEQYRAMRAGAAEAVLQQQRVALALAWAAAGDATRAQEMLKRLPADDRRGSAHWTIARLRILAAIAAGAAVRGETNLAERVADEARDARAAIRHISDEAALALMTAYLVLGRHAEAWQELADWPPAAPSAVIAKIIPAIVARGRGNRILEWISTAPDEHRQAAWQAFFAATAPDPMVPPVRPE